MICSRCGHRNDDDANFCSSCGASLRNREESTLTLTAVQASDLEDDLASYLSDLPEGVGLLVVRSGPLEGSSYRLEADCTAIGRNPDSDIFLDDITVSRAHAEVRLRAGTHHVIDLGSLNGTYVNGDRIDDAALQTGDEVRVGRFELTFLVGEPKDMT